MRLEIRGWKLKEAFPETTFVIKPIVTNPVIPDSQWLAGFTTGEGSFLIGVRKSEVKAGFQVYLTFILTQHLRVELLMGSLIKYLDCGNIIRRSNEDALDFKVTKFSDINGNIIQFFLKNPIVSKIKIS